MSILILLRVVWDGGVEEEGCYFKGFVELERGIRYVWKNL